MLDLKEKCDCGMAFELEGKNCGLRESKIERHKEAKFDEGYMAWTGRFAF